MTPDARESGVAVELGVHLHVDLTGSNCGPGWHAVDLILDGAAFAWSTARIRQGAADHYGVPIHQVGMPRRAFACEVCGEAVFREDYRSRFLCAEHVDDDLSDLPCIDHGIVGCGDCEGR